MFLSSRFWRGVLCLLSVPVSAPLLSQTITSVEASSAAGAKQVVLIGSGFSDADVVTVAGIPLEKIKVSENRIEARLPSGVRLVGGEYVVKISGKTTARASLRLSSEPVAPVAVATSRSAEVQAK